MWNPYKEEFDELQETHQFKGQQWFGKRKDLVEEYSWAIPNEEVLLYVSEFDDIVEVGAGSGYWAKCIEEAGGSVQAFDIDPPEETWKAVSDADVIDIRHYMRDGVLLLVWPPANDMMAAHALTDCPNHVLYVGEPRGGCTANDVFFNHLDDEYGLVAKIDLPSYAGVNDDFYHYVRKV